MTEPAKKELELTCPLCGGREFAGQSKLLPGGGSMFNKPRPVELAILGLPESDRLRTYATACLRCGYVVLTVNPDELKQKEAKARRD